MIRNRVVCVAPSASLAYSVEVVHTNISRYMLRLGRCNYRQLGTIGLHDQPVLEIHTMRAAAPGMSFISVLVHFLGAGSLYVCSVSNE
jgi:hypothetical protein